ncbi:type III-B CRISPR module RAMP protein Cmr1 [bacterium]|nr:type III-B CRISPR module RAMP protein Cmr1 [bacterium]
MNIFSISLKNVTPMFCRGKDSETAEIRAPSIKGQLRWWYRAWNPKALAQSDGGKWSEGQIMGGTGLADQPSPFLLRIRLLQPLKTESWKNTKIGTVQNTRHHVGGFQYLGFSFGLNKQESKNKCIVRDTPFNAIHVFPDPKKCNDEVAKALIASWWLFVHLGGLGARSRRCFGSLVIEKWKWPEKQDLLDALPLPYLANNAADWEKDMKTGLNVLKTWLPADARWPKRWIHPNLGSDTIVVFDTSEPWTSAKSAMEYSGCKLSAERKINKGGSREIDGRVTIGLPLTTGKSVKKEWQPDSLDTEPIKTDHSASSLHMHIGAWQNGYGVCWTKTAGPVPGLNMFRVNVKIGRDRNRTEIREQAHNALDSLMTALPGTRWSPGDE